MKIKLSFDRRGDGAPDQLLLVHGLGSDRHAWTPVIEPLAAEGLDVIAVDLPGFGESPPLALDADHSPAALARALAGLLDELGWTRPHVCGNSLGGWVALELGKQQRVRTVTALAPAGMWSMPLGPRRGLTLRAGGRALRPVLPLLLRSARLRHAALSLTVAHPERVPAQEARRMVLGYLDAPGFAATNAAMRESHFVGGERVRAPVTIAWAEHDRVVRPPRVMPVRARATVVLYDCGHLPTWDDPGQVTRVIRSGVGASREASLPAR